jgi:hypothetical protein
LTVRKITGGGMVIENDVLSRKETAVFLGVCLTTLDRLDIPKTRIRQRVIYKRAEIMKWLDAHTERPKREKQ